MVINVIERLCHDLWQPEFALNFDSKSRLRIPNHLEDDKLRRRGNLFRRKDSSNISPVRYDDDMELWSFINIILN